ncbi:MAG: hypothetical protein A2268_07610 [Candidatus Raymondbacteria bacterium RifOxyA12_full_50_37]|nr:MAG: hypothetical protein A2248_05220 [Candidatus Raymondbacteria bacterium RIFOXYA2_FULL_49_16]OGJ90110.1 MAG: hypothetical protein A2268_07610 [Candidatus Raymondbacteria bacterium RifOxyA12_full_50_37]OGJ94655.1 MAG: hypothetical protein A2350_08405 [Candidatus Raymondbacteria bacterium RifOxyB12_full_50_8]OGJ97688.1 MAG: hypothetical protein A2453_09580 [Candidatus Raymondbacteria bacterium RIFOXYC2_FULL_50_21]OGP43645.1 MAG: hypothetical protein A2324_14340 [Candidatus Raymondbacteria b
MAIQRRSFIQALVSAALFILAAPATLMRKVVSAAQSDDAGKNLPGQPRSRSSMDRPGVAIEMCPDYDPIHVYRAICKALESIQFAVPSGKKILLKPNIMAQNTPDQAASTHPAVVEAVCRIFFEKGNTLTIGDSSAFYQGGGTRRGFETTGIGDAGRKYNARILPFEATRLRKITSGHVLNPLYVTEALFEHDLVVNLPKLKVHRLARYSGALKNMFGCVPGGAKQLYHTLFQEQPDYQEFWGKPLVDVYETARPGLTIMDAIIGLDKDGPAANGEPRATGVVAASENGAALDVVICGIIGFDPYWVPAVREAIARNLVIPSRINTIGSAPLVPYAKLSDLVKKKGLFKKLDNHVFEQFIMEPRIHTSACSKCGVCIEACAPQAIAAGQNGFPRIDYRSCIRCYCCEEYCAAGAISLHGGATNHIVRGVRRIIGL